ncbi:radical SAM protein [Pontibacter litorisediminis]|uniref:radical SAM protein n=1 Tax=Pontibacter litorisediminis TaxID=1846260 RepID=UPI0023EC819D|nr:radical SAM protein [Pontibacter litorisediminis]
MSYSVTNIGSSLYKISNKHKSVYYDNNTLSLFKNEKKWEGVTNQLPSILGNLSDSPFPDNSKRKRLGRLTINVIDTCNLKCKYCYAEYGKYGNSMGRLERESYMDMILELSKYYYSIDRIQFFGGEPLLALDKIKLTCQLFVEMYTSGMIMKLPEFSVVTNGTLLMKPEVQDIIREFKIHITVSCDGPKEITDYLRPKHNKSSKSTTYQELKNGIAVTKANGFSVSIEATYTIVHQGQGITPLDVINSIYSEFNIYTVHLAPASFSLWGDYRPNVELASKDFFEASLISSGRVIRNEGGVLESTLDIIQKISTKKGSSGYCPAYTSQLSIDSKGNAYPCFMSMSNKDKMLGNLLGSDWPNNSANKIFYDYKSQMTNGDFGTKGKVWFDSLISGCAAADNLAMGEYGKDADYQIHEAVVAGALLGLVELN